MKKIIFFMLIIIAIYANIALASVDTKDMMLNYVGIQIEIDDNKIVPKDVTGKIVDPFIIDGTTYLPVRAVSESLGKIVRWDGETYSVYINDSSGEIEIESFSGEIEKKVFSETQKITYNDISIYINNEIIEPKDANGKVVEPFIIDGTTYLPVRAVAEAFNKEVGWVDEEKKVVIKSKSEIANIQNVVVKIIDDIICAEISSDIPINNYDVYSLTEGTIMAEPYLNMRESSSTTASIIATIPNESVVTIKEVVKEGNIDKWYKVTYASKTGFVSADYVKNITATRLIIDLEDTFFDIDTSSKNINYASVDSIRFGAQGNNLNRIVLDLNEISKYKVIQNNDKTKTYLALNENFEIPASDVKDFVLVASNDDKIYLPIDESGDNLESEETNQDNKNEDINTNLSGDENSSINQDEDKEEVVIENLASVDSVKYSSSTNKTKIKIDGDYEYTVFTLENPDRVVIDIFGAKLNVDGPKEINPNNKNLTAVRFSQNEEDIVRVVFDVNSKSEYVITEKTSELSVEIEEISYKNIDYINHETYATLVLKDTDIDYFKTEKSASANKYYITYSSRKFKSGTGNMEIDDEWVDEVIIKSNKITIKGKEKTSYSIKQNGDDVIITMKEQTKADRIILLDAGHGGTDPGACNGSMYEKVYNLKIALKLYDMLKDTDGIEVRISRKDDVYINRDGRLEYVLDNDDADLVVSIHNNSLANKNYQGTMVLFYNKPGEEEEYGITSKEFATIVKNNLVEDLGTIDRGVVSRDDLWILTQNHLGERPDLAITNIPSILCEVVYISNDYEASRLVTESFQQTAAQAIYDGIMEAINIMDNK